MMIDAHDPKEMARYIRALRRQRMLTQRQLAQRSGVNQHAISQIENGLLFPSLKHLRHLARAFGVAFEIRVGARDLP